ncbi:MAG TPA: CoA transferase [Xanthobacteraceae bacterium]|nr:CoA transferase [Xanthobacteraceae bacterium]
MSVKNDGQGPLAGIRVLDLTRVLAGPLCTMTLGDLGADVIKVEHPGRGDDTRAWGPPFAGDESAYFLGVNRNKRGITLNTQDPRGLNILKTLMQSADVVVENFKPGTLDKWGVGYSFIQREAPRTILCSISGYGWTGPKANLPGYDFLLQAESGLMSITGEPDGEPMKLGVAIVDLCTGMYAAISILAALNARNAGAPGQHVQVSLFTTGVSLLANVASNALVSKKPAGRYGNGHPNIVPYRSYACRDGAIAVAVGNDAQFAAFSRAVGRPEWIEHPHFATNPDRVRNRAEIDGLIEAHLATFSTDEVLERLHKASVPASRINTVAQALTDPQTLATGMIAEVEHATAGLVQILGIPFHLGGTPAAIRLPPPTLGQHTDAVLSELAGLSKAEISDLREAGIV